jgi:DNA-binding MarR family transcriptional regulator
MESHYARQLGTDRHDARAGQIAEALFDAAMGERDLTARQAQLLQAIAQRPGANLIALVVAAGIDRSTLGATCRRLVRKGLVIRRRSRKDTRAWIVKLTPAGEADSGAPKRRRPRQPSRRESRSSV